MGNLYADDVRWLLRTLEAARKDYGFMLSLRPDDVSIRTCVKCGDISLDSIRDVLLRAALADVEVEPTRIDPIATVAAACAQPQPAPDLDAALAGMRALNAKAPS